MALGSLPLTPTEGFLFMLTRKQQYTIQMAVFD